MSASIILASASEIRRDLLKNSGVAVVVDPVRVDEDSVRRSMERDGASPREIADALAEAKARRGSNRHPGAWVIGCDQVLAFDGKVFGKAETAEEVLHQLEAMNGKRHNLLSAAVIYRDGEPQWRHIGVVRMQMRQVSAEYLRDYVARNWESIRFSVGGYKLEEEGVRLFQSIAGDYFCVLGLPLLEILSYLTLREVIPG